MKKVFVVGDMKWYKNFISDSSLVYNIDDADIVLFTGGEDVTPSLYGEEIHPSTYYNTDRDEKEMEVFNSIPADKLVIGICRGSQFMSVMNGGKLVQNVNKHGLFGTHSIIGKDGAFEITSTHHQMQYPYNLPNDYYTILYKANPSRSSIYEGTGIDKTMIDKYGEPEVVLYTVPDKPRCLAIQGHPEMMDNSAPVVEMLNNLISELLN